TTPLSGALVTAGGRLLLAVLQREVERRGGAFVWTATDAMAIVAGGEGPVSGLSPEVQALSMEEVADIQARFQQLSPYDPAAVTAFLKRDGEGTAYAIASNRYCLVKPEGTFARRPSAHGMSGIIAPN